jgi:PIN domain nuclease of toxin-antitoxin system
VRERYLLDSNVLLWLNLDPSRIPRTVVGDLDTADEVYFSAASAWELSIKQSLGTLRMTGSISAFVARAGFLEIAVTTKFAAAAARLPMHHRDPFDRIIVVQAMEEGLTLITADRRLASYDVKILRV